MACPDLLSLVLLLKPGKIDNLDAPAWWGRESQAFLLRSIAKVDPDLAARLHEGSSLRPYSASTLMGHFPGGKIDPEETYILRLTALAQDIAGILVNASQPGGGISSGDEVELDRRPFRVEKIFAEAGSHPWAGALSYADLLSRVLPSSNPSHQITLQLTSPTSFKSGGKHVPLPLPELVFGSLLERWNAFAPSPLPAEVKRYAAECLGISRYHLHSRPVPLKGEGLRIGAVGWVTCSALNYDRYWMGAVHALADYALFAGLGAGTAMGMGQSRAVPHTAVGSHLCEPPLPEE